MRLATPGAMAPSTGQCAQQAPPALTLAEGSHLFRPLVDMPPADLQSRHARRASAPVLPERTGYLGRALQCYGLTVPGKDRRPTDSSTVRWPLKPEAAQVRFDDSAIAASTGRNSRSENSEAPMFLCQRPHRPAPPQTLRWPDRSSASPRQRSTPFRRPVSNV